MHSLIIHLPGASARQPNVAHLMRQLPNAQVVTAEDGHGQIPVTRVDTGDAFAPAYPFALGQGEVGCFLSHQKCWQMIIDQDLPGALIAEDDLYLGARWPEAFDVLCRVVSPEHFIRMPVKDRESPKSHPQQATLFSPKIIGLSTTLQYVGSQAAARLLAATRVIDRPVDTFLQMHWIHEQHIYTILPNGISEISAQLGGSNIQKKSRQGRLARECKRFFYRRQIARRPQRLN